MKRIIWIAIGALLLGVNPANAQSLGDVARSVRKGKTQQSPENRRFDNDNLPKTDHLSIVGPPVADTNAVAQSTDPGAAPDPSTQATQNPAPDPNLAAAERK